MRVVMFRGYAVKRQKKVAPDKIELRFFTRGPLVVTPQEWDAEKENKYYDNNVSRKNVVRAL